MGQTFRGYPHVESTTLVDLLKKVIAKRHDLMALRVIGPDSEFHKAFEEFTQLSRS